MEKKLKAYALSFWKKSGVPKMICGRSFSYNSGLKPKLCGIIAHLKFSFPACPKLKFSSTLFKYAENLSFGQVKKQNIYLSNSTIQLGFKTQVVWHNCSSKIL
ncbi:MAG: hypothetical protein AAF443_07595, partial [Chlamydiota bacterium]